MPAPQNSAKHACCPDSDFFRLNIALNVIEWSIAKCSGKTNESATRREAMQEPISWRFEINRNKGAQIRSHFVAPKAVSEVQALGLQALPRKPVLLPQQADSRNE